MTSSPAHQCDDDDEICDPLCCTPKHANLLILAGWTKLIVLRTKYSE